MSPGLAATRLVVVFLLVLGAVTVPGLAATGDASTLHQVSAEENRENTSLLIEVQANGDARWTVSVTFNLTTANETAAYRDLATAFEDGETEALGLNSFQRASDLASASTGRPMEITDVTRTAAPAEAVENGTGRLTLEFTWANFGQVDTDRLTIGDVFRTSEGQWLPGLEPDQTLTIRAPPGFGIVNGSVAPVDGSLQWDGPTEFGERELDATFTGSGASGTGGSGTGGEPPNGDTDDGLLWMVLFVVGIGALTVVGYFVVQREGDVFPSPAAGTDDDSDDAAIPAAGTETTEDTTDDGEEDEDIDLELLSDEERVERLLEENGGRMKQATIVKETGWSNAKVSQLLSSMQEEGRIDKLRIGRENLISFPDEDITDIRE
jgi:hypothetical protein